MNNASEYLVLPNCYIVLSEECNVLYIGCHFDMIITMRSDFSILDFFL